MKIFGIASNYLVNNITEGKTLSNCEAPVVFTKADSALLKGGKPFFIPDFTQRCEFEVAVVVKICKLGRSISSRFAHRYYDEVTLGVDFTAQDLLKELRSKGEPWEMAKGFDGSAAIGNFLPIGTLGKGIQDLHFRLKCNGTTVQEGDTGEMLHKVDDIVAYLSQFYTLKMGDLIFTGTPAGAAPVHPDDHLEGWLEGEKVFSFYAR